MSLGNHEWWLEDRDCEALTEAEITLPDNAFVETDGFAIGGLFTKADEKMLDAFCDKTGHKILLCHHPDCYEKYLKNRNIDLIFAGHAYGGHIRVLVMDYFLRDKACFRSTITVSTMSGLWYLQCVQTQHPYRDGEIPIRSL